MSLKPKLITDKLPSHVAIIMDGNGRWAKERGEHRLVGHQHGVESVKAMVEAAAELSLSYLTLYAFSTENWNRPQEEVSGLMSILVDAIEAETTTLMRNNIKLLTIGDISVMPDKVLNSLNKIKKCTSINTGLTLVLALSYSSRWEINQATKNIALDVSSNKLNVDEITDEVFESYLTTSGMPDPDLLIRTSGESRLSNFLLWQLAYSEFYFTKTLWPDFRAEQFYEALFDYQERERRFGKTSEQLSIK